MMEVKKPTSQERKDATAELRKKHQSVFDALGISDAVFVPKMAHYQKGLSGLHMGFFESELLIGQDVYTEMVSMSMVPEDPDRTLLKLRYNEHFEDEFAKSLPMENGSCRYFVPVDELEILEVKKPKKSKAKAQTIKIASNPDDGDLPLQQMTMRDYAAIELRMPTSNKEWLNTMIKEANIKPF